MTHNQMRREIDGLEFAQLELTLYLDINPGDEAARAQWAKNMQRMRELGKQYYTQTGKIWPMQQNYHGGMREWVDDPWPWEYQY